MRYLVKRIPSTSLVQYDGSRYYCEIAGGTSERATVDGTELLAGSKYLDVQTGTWYVYDELTNAWAVSAEGGSADPAVVEAAVEAWLDAHPEATTTVQDGSITYAKLDSTLKGKADAVSSLSDEIDGIKATSKNRKSTLSVETYSFFKGKKLASSFDADHVFNVSGSSGDTVLTITGDRSGNTLISDDLNCAVIIQYNESKALPYILREFTENTITVYPAIDADINNAVLAPFMADSQHLTIYGYRAYIQCVNNANPKHCEKNKYVAKYHPTTGVTPTVFSAMGVSASIFTYSQNDNPAISYQYGSFGTIVYPYADYATTAKYGLKWSVDTGNHAGYLETFVGIKAASGLSMYKDTGHEMYIDVYADGVLIEQIVKNTNPVERICVDYTESQKTIELQVYYTTMRKNNNADSIFVGETTFWVNENYPNAILPAGATVSLLFDSWGGRGSTENVVESATPWHSGATWPQGESGLEVRRILTAKSGFVPPVYNTSRGSMTSRWGQAWFGVAVRSKNPNVVLTDFGINDYHTTIGGTWENVLDPYGNTIVMAGNPLTVAEYAENMQNIFNMAIMSDIQPIFVEPNIGASLPWTLYMLNALAEQVTI